jgi:arylsulfatase A-like enzyme
MSPDARDGHADVTGPRTVEAVERWIERTTSGEGRRPFFLFLHLFDVHYDYRPPPQYVEKFDPGYEGTLDASDFPHNPAIEPNMAPQDLRHLLALYDGEIRFTDDNLGRILAALDAHGRLRDALVVVTADHGEEFFEHGGKGHQKSLFDEVVRVPLVFRWPGGLPADRVIGDQVRLVDLAPTILALAGLRPGDPMQGRDLSPLLRGGVLESVPALIELLVDRNDVRGIRRQDSKTISWRHAGQSFLYDLLRDPREENPIGAPSGDLDRELAAIDGLLEEGFGLTRGAAPTRFEMAPHLRRRLGVLGYAGEETQDPEPRQK